MPDCTYNKVTKFGKILLGRPKLKQISVKCALHVLKAIMALVMPCFADLDDPRFVLSRAGRAVKQVRLDVLMYKSITSPNANASLDSIMKFTCTETRKCLVV